MRKTDEAGEGSDVARPIGGNAAALDKDAPGAEEDRRRTFSDTLVAGSEN
jgi:hypothetical protein